VDAYGQAGYSQKGSRATQTVDAYRLSKRPKVQREVARLLQQRAFPADDYKRLQETTIAGLMEMFLYDANFRVRLKAGSTLLEYADAGLKLHPEPTAKERAYDQLTQYIEDSARKHRGAMGREPEQALRSWSRRKKKPSRLWKWPPRTRRRRRAAQSFWRSSVGCRRWKWV
jgi:hypothetical protein